MGLREFAIVFVMACWPVFAVRFYVNHRRVRRERGPEVRDGELRAPASMIGLLLEGVAVALIFYWRKPLSAITEPAAIVSMLLAATSAWFASESIRHLGKQWRIKAVVTADHELVKSGPYGIVRHPIYLSLMGMAIATGLLLTRPAGLALAIAVYVIGTEIRVHAEDAILHKRFGPEFDRYRSQVKAYLPFLR